MVARLRASVLIAVLILLANASLTAADQALEVPAVFARVQQGEYEQTGDIGAVIKKVVKGLAAERAGAQAKDRLLAIDDIRVHDAAEASAFLSIRLRDEKAQSWIVKRGDGIVTLTVQGWQPDGRTGIDFVRDGGGEIFSRQLDALGVTIAEKDRDTIDSIPARAAAAIATWKQGNQISSAQKTWLSSFAALFAATVRGEVPPAEKGEAPPIAILSELNHFYRAIAARRAAGKDDCDSATIGDPTFAGLYFPYPVVVDGELGLLPVEAKVGKVLEQAARGTDNLRERQRLASEFANSGGDIGEQFLAASKAALLDPNTWGDVPNWRFLTTQPLGTASRGGQVLKALRKRYDSADGGEKAFIGYALVLPVLSENGVDAASKQIEELREQAPFLCQQACFAALRSTVTARNAQPEVRKKLVDKFFVQRPILAEARSATAIFRTCFARFPDLAMQIAGGDPGAHPALDLFRSNPSLVARLLSAEGPWIEDIVAEHHALMVKVNHVSWQLASREDCIDAEQAMIMAKTLQGMGFERRVLEGAFLEIDWLDTVGGCYARDGKYDVADIWMKHAIDQSGWEGRYEKQVDNMKRQQIYRTHKPCTEPVGQSTATQRKLPDGSSEEGYLLGGRPTGHWRHLSSSGALLAEGLYADGQMTGVWTTYFQQNRKREQGYYVEDLAQGPWKRWNEAGVLIREAWFLNGHPTGSWRWYHDNGQLCIRGRFVDGRRIGLWQRFDQSGKLAEEVVFKDDIAQGSWLEPDAQDEKPGVMSWSKDNGASSEPNPAPRGSTANDF